MRAVSSLLIAVALVAAVSGEAQYENDVLVLTDANFESATKDVPLILVEFYAPWCGHCKKLEPEFARAAKELKALNPPVVLAKMDATENKDTPLRFGVSGYPTLKIIRDGEEFEYSGPRDADGIVSYMKVQAQPASLEVSSVEEAERFVPNRNGGSKEVVVFGFFKSVDADLGSLMAIAERLRSVGLRFIHTHNEEVMYKYQRRHCFVIFRPWDNDEPAVWPSEEPLSQSTVWNYLAEHALPPVGNYTEHTALLYSRRQIPFMRVFTDTDPRRNAQGIRYLTNRLNKIAKEFKNISITLASAKENESFLRGEIGFTEENFKKGNMITIQDNQRRKFVFEGESFVAADVREFVRKYLAGEVEPYHKSQPIPDDVAKPGDGRVVEVVGKTFESVVMHPEHNVLIEFYAPWCGHCKSLAPIYDELAAAVKDTRNLVIAKIDATENDHPKDLFSVQGFPTIYLSSVSAKDKPVQFEGERTLAGFKAFLSEKGLI